MKILSINTSPPKKINFKNKIVNTSIFKENNPNITLQPFNRPFTNIDISNGNNLINSVIRTNPNIYYNQNDSNNTFQNHKVLHKGDDLSGQEQRRHPLLE